MKLDLRQKLFVVLAAIFVTCLVVGDLIGSKLVDVEVGSFAAVISIGMIPFPVTFLLTDLLNEFYGKKVARFITWLGFSMALLTFTFLFVAVQLPFAKLTQSAEWPGVTAATFDNVFAGGQRILFASMVAYLTGQFIDITVFHALKRFTQNRMLWLRATGSTLVSQLVDTAVIQTIAWWGILPFAVVLKLGLVSYVVKVGVAVLLTPLIYGLHALVERRFGIQAVRLDEDGNPRPQSPT